jgi:hypothetical protein
MRLHCGGNGSIAATISIGSGRPGRRAQLDLLYDAALAEPDTTARGPGCGRAAGGPAPAFLRAGGPALARSSGTVREALKNFRAPR